MLVQAVKRNNEWIIPDIPEFHAQNEDRIFLDIHLAHKVDKESNADDGQLWNDEYLEGNWKRIASKSLADLPEDYF